MNGLFVFAGVLAFIGALSVLTGIVWLISVAVERGHRLKWLESKAKHLDDRLDRWSDYHFELSRRVDELEKVNVKTKPRKR